MSNVPLARELIADVATELASIGRADLSRRLIRAIGELYRRPLARPRAPVQSRKVDPETAERMRAYALEHLEESQQAIGEAFGTNHGRVSDALRGEL